MTDATLVTPSRRSGPRLPAVADGPPAVTDALEVPEAAGRALLLRRGLRTGAVAWDRAAGRMDFLVPRGSAEELPGLLEWLEWGGVELDLLAHGPYSLREAAVWLRPPGEGCEVDLVRLVSAAATECHRVRLLCATQPFAFS